MNTYKYEKVSILCVLKKPPANNQNHNAETTTGTCSINVYKDNWFDRLAINHLSQSIQATTGLRNNKSGYEGLAEAAKMVYTNFNSRRQVNLVVEALQKAFPKPILSLMKMVLPQSKWARVYCAAFTKDFFSWLVGSCEVSGGNQLRGMCTNLCKMPSQLFIKDTLGMPVNMVPNFDDMSCEMIFGQDPPPPDTDPAFVQPCYKLRKLGNKHQRDCNSQMKKKDVEIS